MTGGLSEEGSSGPPVGGGAAGSNDVGGGTRDSVVVGFDEPPGMARRGIGANPPGKANPGSPAPPPGPPGGASPGASDASGVPRLSTPPIVASGGTIPRSNSAAGGSAGSVGCIGVSEMQLPQRARISERPSVTIASPARSATRRFVQYTLLPTRYDM